MRFDVFTFPVLVNVTHAMLSSLVRKLSLPDTVTTNNTSIPPYLIVNDTGISIKCVFQSVRGARRCTKDVRAHQELTLDVLALAKELGLSAADAADGLREHTVGITFDMGN